MKQGKRKPYCYDSNGKAIKWQNLLEPEREPLKRRIKKRLLKWLKR